MGVSGIAGACACYPAPAPMLLGGSGRCSGRGEDALGAQEGVAWWVHLGFAMDLLKAGGVGCVAPGKAAAGPDPAL